MQQSVVWLLIFVSSGFAGLIDRPTEYYEDHHIVQILPESEEQQSILRKLLAQETDCEVLKEPRILGLSVDVLCHKLTAEELGSLLNYFRLPFTTSSLNLVDSYSDLLDRTTAQDVPSALNNHIRLDTYNRYESIQKYLMKLAEDYPQIVRLDFASSKTSHEGRNLTLIKIGTSGTNGIQTKKSVWIDAGIHAREWIAPAVALFTIDSLVKVFLKQASNESLLSDGEKDLVSVNWLIMPLLNPDGYEYSHTKDRMWRKNRAPAPVKGGCAGVDLNRNYDVDGYGVGASSNACQETYKGLSKGSEPEVKMASEILMTNRDSIRVSISLHSYGPVILTSWGYKTELPPDNDRLIAFGNDLAKAIKKVHGRIYDVGPAGVIFYVAGGASDDFAKARAGIPFVTTIELPGDGNGFLLPATKILSVCEEMWEAMFHVAKTARNEP